MSGVEWRDRRSLWCRMGFHKWFRDEMFKRHCLRCGEREHFIIDWVHNSDYPDWWEVEKL